LGFHQLLLIFKNDNLKLLYVYYCKRVTPNKKSALYKKFKKKIIFGVTLFCYYWGWMLIIPLEYWKKMSSGGQNEAKQPKS